MERKRKSGLSVKTGHTIIIIVSRNNDVEVYNHNKILKEI